MEFNSGFKGLSDGELPVRSILNSSSEAGNSGVHREVVMHSRPTVSGTDASCINWPNPLRRIFCRNTHNFEHKLQMVKQCQ